MKYETITARLLEAAAIAFATGRAGERITDAMEAERERILKDLEGDRPELCAQLKFGRFSFVRRNNGGPVATVCFGGQGKLECLSDLSAAGVLHLTSNYFLMATKGTLLGDPQRDHISLSFMAGSPVEELRPGVYTSRHKPTLPFDLGDLSGTDCALIYLAVRKIFSEDPASEKLARRRFPLDEETRQELSKYAPKLAGNFITSEAA